MSQNTLIEKIKADAAKTVGEIKAAGAAEIESIQSDIEAELATLTKTHEANLEKEKAHMKLVAVSKAKQSGNIAVQTAKRKQIDAIFSAVAESLVEQDADAYIKFFSKHIAEIVPKDIQVEYVNAPKNRQEETVKILQETGLSADVKVDGSFKAGLVVKAKDGVYDVTLERLMNEKRDELEMVVVNKVEA